ncbi:MAG TPA: arylsulfatase [Candidatus Kapabacteria bacterium]|nr:arylsulfatase [Candidatus Kapabacteria bacterium]
MINFRRVICPLLLLAAFLQIPFHTQAASQPSRPNIIFILADDLGYGELGCYGQQKIKTPNLDRMAREGMRFTRFYAGSTVCAPSRSVLMTGQHTGHTTVRGNAGATDRSPQMLRSNDVTVAEVLKTAGYRTGLVGKWGLGMNDDGHPTLQGFDYFYGYLSQHHAHNHFPDFLWRNRERVKLSNKVTPMGDEGAGYATNAVEFAGDLLAEEALDFIEASTNRAEPFFLYFSPVVPHANNERKKALGNGMEVPDFGPYQDEPWSDALKGHAAMITRLDADIGRLLQKLKLLDIQRNTLVIFSSDNGPHSEGGQDPEFFDPNGPVRGYKRDFTDGGIRVPFIAWWPGKIQPATANHLAYFGDMMATFSELAGATSPKNIDSISIVPTLLRPRTHGGRAVSNVGPAQRHHHHLYFEFHEGGFSQAVILDGRWKGIRMKRLDAPIQIYDLHTDPGETRDLAATHLSVLKEVELLFRTERTDSPLWPVKEAPLTPKGGATNTRENSKVTKSL